MTTKRDVNQIIKLEHDEANNAKRVKMVDTEISIELDHTDGDSVTCHPAKLTASVLGVDTDDNGQEIIPALDCSSIRKLNIKIDGSGTVRVLLSPADTGNYFYEASQADLDNLCARRVKVESVNAVGDVHLVGRS